MGLIDYADTFSATAAPQDTTPYMGYATNTDTFSATMSPQDTTPYYISDQDAWDDSFNVTFDTTTETINDSSFWSSAWDKANTPLGTGIIGGLAAGYTNYQNQQSADDKYDTNLDYRKAYDERAFALQEQQLANQRAAIAVNERAQADKENTRKAHNTSINAKPGGSKKVSFG